MYHQKFNECQTDILLQQIQYRMNKKQMSQRGSFVRKYHGQNLKNLLKMQQRRHELATTAVREQQTLPKFRRPSSQSYFQRHQPHHNLFQTKPKPKAKLLYSKLSNQLKQIQQSIDSLSMRRRKKHSKYKQKVITQISQKQPKHLIYNEILSQIREIKNKAKSPLSKTKEEPIKTIKTIIKPAPEQQTLFYGIDYIDGIQFKIKLKLSKSGYVLLGKNNQLKIMLEMGFQQYMKLQQKQLKGNPCNIFRHLVIENNKIRLKLNQKKRSQSFKSYLGYY